MGFDFFNCKHFRSRVREWHVGGGLESVPFCGEPDRVAVGGSLNPVTPWSDLIPLTSMCKPQPGFTLGVVFFVLYSAESKDLKSNVLRYGMPPPIQPRRHHSLLLGPAASPVHVPAWSCSPLSLRLLGWPDPLQRWKCLTGIFPAALGKWGYREAQMSYRPLCFEAWPDRTGSTVL